MAKVEALKAFTTMGAAYVKFHAVLRVNNLWRFPFCTWQSWEAPNSFTFTGCNFWERNIWHIWVPLWKLRQGVARLIKTQRQILGFNLKVRKAKQPVTGSYLYLSPKWRSCLQESQNETVCQSCLPFLYSSLVLGLKACTTTAGFLWQTSVVTGIRGVCHHCLVCKAGQCDCFTLWTSGQLY